MIVNDIKRKIFLNWIVILDNSFLDNSCLDNNLLWDVKNFKIVILVVVLMIKDRLIIFFLGDVYKLKIEFLVKIYFIWFIYLMLLLGYIFIRVLFRIIR